VFTHGFRDRDELRRHFLRHGGHLGCATSLGYEAMADAFLGGPIGANVAECTRGGDLVRYNQVTQEFGVLAPGGIIRTYLILGRSPAQNRLYFLRNCL
jgi:hypothetical protein